MLARLMLARVMLARAVVAWLCLFDVGDGDEGMLLASVVEANGAEDSRGSGASG